MDNSHNRTERVHRDKELNKIEMKSPELKYSVHSFSSIKKSTSENSVSLWQKVNTGGLRW